MISACDPFSDDEVEEKSAAPPQQNTQPQSYADLQRAKMVFVPAPEDAWNDAVSFGGDVDARFAAADLMPDGYDDTKEQREKALAANPKDDNALLAPRREEIEEFLEASAIVHRQQKMQAPTGYRSVGARSHIWPEIDPDQQDSRTSYANYHDERSLSDQREAALRRSRVAAAFESQ